MLKRAQQESLIGGGGSASNPHKKILLLECWVQITKVRGSCPIRWRMGSAAACGMEGGQVHVPCRPLSAVVWDDCV
jgi:hypothetical protein